MRSLVPVALWILILAGSGCGDETIVLATLGHDAGTLPRCIENGDCSGASYCAKPSCDAVGGSCEAVPLACAPDGSPVCGCNGLTYATDCLRSAASVASSTAGACR
jgi:hypothetical protein